MTNRWQKPAPSLIVRDKFGLFEKGLVPLDDIKNRERVSRFFVLKFWLYPVNKSQGVGVRLGSGVLEAVGVGEGVSEGVALGTVTTGVAVTTRPASSQP